MVLALIKFLISLVQVYQTFQFDSWQFDSYATTETENIPLAKAT